MQMTETSEIVIKLYARFELEVLDIVRRESANYRLVESGQPRVNIRSIVIGLAKTAEGQVDSLNQVKLYMCFASDFASVQEYDLALECFGMALNCCESIPNEMQSTKYRVEIMHNIVKSDLAVLNRSKACRFAPMFVSKLLVSLQQLRKSLEIIFDLTVRNQEELAWQVLNSCKLIMEIGQPLVWHSCGKYVLDTMMFAGLSMEAVINLCTIRHMPLRMKIYSTGFCAALAQNSLDEAAGALEHTVRQVLELRQREEIDPPVPETSLRCLDECESDVAIMRIVLDFWRDPDSLDVSVAHLQIKYPSVAAMAAPLTLSDRILAECIRVHLLTSGNVNEPYRKRSACILKAMLKVLLPYNAQAPSLEGVTREVDVANLAIAQLFSAQTLLEVTNVAVFEVTEGVDVRELLTKLWSLSEDVLVLSESRGAREEVELQAAFDLLRLTTEIVSIEQPSTAEKSGEHMSMVVSFVARLEELVYSTAAYRRNALVKKVSLHMWTRFLYPGAQRALSAFASEGAVDTLQLVTPAICAVAKALDLVGLEDAVTVGSMALLAANLLWLSGDKRGCISTLRQAISCVEEHRAARVDFMMHSPEDVRDVLALQRASFTARADEQDWFHSVKRLGAHAFAGYGIFGLSSSADRSDCALAEIHTELVTLYFRFELQLAVQAGAHRVVIKHTSALNDKEKEKTLAATAKMPTKTLKKTAAATKASTTRLPTLSAEGSGEVNADKIHVVSALRAFCAKNGYFKCLLLLEMARIDSDELRSREYLRVAQLSVEDCEAQEQLLKESFRQLLVMTNTTRVHPLVIARSNRYLYVAPVGCRKQQSKTSYYRVFAKEKGSGTDVSIYNDDLAGCERRILVHDLQMLKDSVVRIGPLRGGEVYVVGALGFSQDGKPCGVISPSSPVVEAVNPLPTILLWALLNQTAAEVCSLPRLSRNTSVSVCDRYFLTTPVINPRVIGKGTNLFLFSEPAMCMLALQQSSPLLLLSFINAFINYEMNAAAFTPQRKSVSADSEKSTSGAAHWIMRRPWQLAKLESLHRTALVAKVACCLSHHDLTLQCVKMGYMLCIDLARFDAVHLAYSMQSPLVGLILALQSIPKRNWRALEHKLYSRLLALLVKVAALNRNLTPVISVLNNFYPESLDKKRTPAVLPPGDLLHLYTALAGVVKQHVSSAHLAPMLQQMGDLHVELTTEEHAKYTAATSVERVGFLWRMSVSQRLLRVSGAAVEFVSVVAEKAVASPEKLQLETWILNERPESMSDYLRLVLHMGRELVGAPSSSSSERPSAQWHRLVSKTPIFAEYVTADVRSVLDGCGLKILQPIALLAARPPSPRAAAAANKKPTKVDPKAPVVEVAPPEDPLKVPARFLSASAEESENQMVAVAEILLLTANTCYADSVHIDSFPRSTTGPQMRIDMQMHTAASDSNDTALTLDEVPSSAVQGLFSETLSRSECVRFLGAAMELFSKGGAHSSAVLVASRLWMLICSEWKDPLEFREEFVSLGGNVHRALTSLVGLLEAMSFFEVSVDVNGIESEETVIPGATAVNNVLESSADNDKLNAHQAASVGGRSGLTRREVRENMVILRDLASFLVKTDWLCGAHSEVVRLGSTIFQLYSLNCPEYAKSLGDHCLPLVLNSQEMLVSTAQAKLVDRQKDMDDFVLQYEEAQKRKRKKKLRIARTDKDEEELIFDAECAAHQAAIDEAQAVCDACLQALEVVNTQQKQFDTLYSTGTQLLDKVKQASTRLVRDLRAQYGASFDLRTLVEDEAVQDRLDVTLYQFNQVVSFLREKKERLVLLEALKEQGDLLLLFGRLVEVRQVWHDAVDGLFNTIDSCLSWPAVCDKALHFLEPDLVVGVLPIMVVLGRLSRFCVSGDLDAKVGYCRMAAELCRIPFQESYGHPQTLVGFAAYVCLDLGGTHSLGMNPEVLDARSLALSLEEVAVVLIAEKQFVSALPVVVLWEYLCSSFLLNASQWLRARLARVKILIGCQHFAEAVSMLAAVKSSVHGIRSQTFSDALRVCSTRDTQTLTAFETSCNGLDFFGLAPFFNNLPPDDPANIKAVEWIRALPEDFEGFAQSFVLRLPEKVLSAEERVAAEAAAEKAAAEAAELAKKAKGKATKQGTSNHESTAVTCAPMFSLLQLADMTATCGQLLLAIGLLDRQATARQSVSLAAVGESGVDLLSKAIGSLFSCADAASIKSAAWISLYGRCQLLLCEYKVLKRKHREALADALKFKSFLKSSVFSALNGDSKFALCQHWFAASLLVADIADRQGRFSEAIILSTQSATEASMLYCGFWLRALLLLRARVQYKLGQFEQSLQSIDACIGQYQMNNLQDLSLVRCLALRATVLRERRIYADKQLAAAAFVASIEVLRSAKGIVDALSEFNGAFPADSNVVFGRGESAVSLHHRIAPILHNLTELHNNEPELTLAATIDTERTSSLATPKSPAKGRAAPQLSLHNENKSLSDTNATLRLGPVDSSENIYSASEFCNIYLAETRVAVTVYAALCSVLDDFRTSAGACASSEKCEREVLDEQELLSESALKLMRQSIFVSPLNRVSLLNLAGKIRVAKAAKYALSMEGDKFLDVLFGPFRAALQVAVASSSHPWELIRSVCVQLVEAHGDPLLDLGEAENEARMRTATVYLIAAVKAGNQLATLTRNTIGLSDDPVFASAVPSEQLLSIVANCSSSSATLPRTKPAVDVPVVVAKGAAPAKAAKGVPVVVTAPSGPSGRDALFLLNSVLRECDPLWLDGPEQDVYADIHGLLKKEYPSYGSRCSFETPPDSKMPAYVPPGSVSALWTPTRTPTDFAVVQSRAVNSLDYSQIGWYSHVAVFFLLGDRKTKVVVPVAPVVPIKGGGAKVDPNAILAAPATSSDPVLTRVVLSRVDVTHLERRLRDIRTRFMDATVKKFPKMLYQCNEEFARTVCMLVGLLKSGVIVEADLGIDEAVQRSRASTASDEQRYSYQLAENGAVPGGYLLTVKLSGAKQSQSVSSLQLEVSEQLMHNLAGVLSADRDTDCLLDGEVCGLLRSSLGHHVQQQIV